MFIVPVVSLEILFYVSNEKGMINAEGHGQTEATAFIP
jgi:hypothetical protein